MPGLNFQAVILAGGDDKKLYPLSSGGVKALLPVANKPMLSYPLRTLSEAGLRHAFVVVSGDKTAAAITAWIQTEFSAPGSMQCEVITVPEEYGTADALRSIASKISSQTFVCLSGDLLTDVPVNALVASHQMNSSLATMVLSPRKTSPASETKPGKPPKGVDCVGLDPSGQHLLFYVSSPETLRDLKVPLPIVKRYGQMSISSNLSDAHLYVFDRSLLATLSSNPSLSSLRQDVFPFLTQQQLKRGAAQAATAGAAQAGVASPLARSYSTMEEMVVPAVPLPGANFMDMSHTAAVEESGGALRVFQVPPGSYCARIQDVQSYGETNREVADPSVALHISGLKPNKYDNIVGASSTIGNKTTIAAACMVGEGCVLGDKSSIKRSVLGNNVKLGVNVKVINSVIMDGVTLGEGVTVQNSVVCANAQVKDKATLKDCQIGHGFVVAGGVEYKGEVLAKAPPPGK